MRRILVVFMMLIPFFLSADTVENQTEFSLSLNKSGTNMIRVSEVGDDQKEKTSIVFALDKEHENYISNPAHTPALESFRISWSIYSPDYASNTSADLYLDFESYAGDNEFMMRKVDSVSSEVDKDGRGLNYNISIDQNSSLNNYEPKPGNINISGSSNDPLPSGEDGNRIYLFSSDNLNPYTGETGYADFSLKLNPPTDGYVTGQYEGQVSINLIIN